MEYHKETPPQIMVNETLPLHHPAPLDQERENQGEAKTPHSPSHEEIHPDGHKEPIPSEEEQEEEKIDEGEKKIDDEDSQMDDYLNNEDDLLEDEMNDLNTMEKDEVEETMDSDENKEDDYEDDVLGNSDNSFKTTNSLAKHVLQLGTKDDEMSTFESYKRGD